MIRGGALELVTVGRVLTSHKRPLALALLGIECVRCAHIVRQPLPSTSLSHLFAARGATHGAAARHCRLDNIPSAAPTGRRAGPSQPEIHDLPQRDHGGGLVLSDARGCQSRGGRPRRANGAGILLTIAPRSLRAQATPRPTTRTSSSTATTRTAWCTASEGARVPPRLTCVCDPQRS